PGWCVPASSILSYPLTVSGALRPASRPLIHRGRWRVSRHRGSRAPVGPPRPSTARDGGSDAPAARPASRFPSGQWWRAGILVVICVIAAVTIGRTVLNGRSRPASAAKAGSVKAIPREGIDGGSYLLIRSTSLDREYGRVGLVTQSDPAGPRMLSSLQ